MPVLIALWEVSWFQCGRNSLLFQALGQYLLFVSLDTGPQTKIKVWK